MWEDEIPKLLDDMKSWYDIKVSGILGGRRRSDDTGKKVKMEWVPESSSTRPTTST